MLHFEPLPAGTLDLLKRLSTRIRRSTSRGHCADASSKSRWKFCEVIRQILTSVGCADTLKVTSHRRAEPVLQKTQPLFFPLKQYKEPYAVGFCTLSRLHIDNLENDLESALVKGVSAWCGVVRAYRPLTVFDPNAWMPWDMVRQ